MNGLLNGIAGRTWEARSSDGAISTSCLSEVIVFGPKGTWKRFQSCTEWPAKTAPASGIVDKVAKPVKHDHETRGPCEANRRRRRQNDWTKPERITSMS